MAEKKNAGSEADMAATRALDRQMQAASQVRYDAIAVPYPWPQHSCGVPDCAKLTIDRATIVVFRPHEVGETWTVKEEGTYQVVATNTCPVELRSAVLRVSIEGPAGIYVPYPRPHYAPVHPYGYPLGSMAPGVSVTTGVKVKPTGAGVIKLKPSVFAEVVPHATSKETVRQDVIDPD